MFRWISECLLLLLLNVISLRLTTLSAGIVSAYSPTKGVAATISPDSIHGRSKKKALMRFRIKTMRVLTAPRNGSPSAVDASLHAEQAAGGMSLRSLLNQIESRISGHADLVFKLREAVAATLGASLNDGLSRRFDMRLAESSLRLFSLEDVPVIRGPLPAGVSDVHFRSDLSALTPLSIEALIDGDPAFWDLLPRLG